MGSGRRPRASAPPSASTLRIRLPQERSTHATTPRARPTRQCRFSATSGRSTGNARAWTMPTTSFGRSVLFRRVHCRPGKVFSF
ncbi:unnamed protein product [Symbiodinium natans]|uniref:Uncharacterized protein n=1 Tax=Symbiodinium natans TaxID=878477 RepID=A0A812MZP7_9DINO|nr:unnamed protein product [Symbiodinium natans]